ncbi:MAG: RnfABCDGE type electron transport complex subunit G [Candidatus Krumholzibacteriota bacterium]|nr:RnfABCDGE type electron transport complex subunit G [Candidatus Krumholzibacteriota bacterium]
MKEILRLCAVLTIIAAVSAGVLAYVSAKTEEPIRNALREETLSAVRSVLPPFDNKPDEDTVVLPVVFAGDTLETTFYRGRLGNAVVGAAFPVVSMDGYSGEIAIMVGVDTLGVVRGIEILRHLETPGLGAKIETEAFRLQYGGTSLEDPATWAVTKDGGTFVPITGATISSRAVTNAVAEGLRFFAAHRGEIFATAADAAREVER